jgi:hypothetical protein
MIRERLVHIHYDDSKLDFESEAHIEGFYAALGRATAYGMSGRSNGSIDYVSIAFNESKQFVAGFFKPADTIEDLEDKNQLWGALQRFQEGTPHVINATPSKEGRSYNFTGV